MKYKYSRKVIARLILYQENQDNITSKAGWTTRMALLDTGKPTKDDGMCGMRSKSKTRPTLKPIEGLQISEMCVEPIVPVMNKIEELTDRINLLSENYKLNKEK